MLEGSETINEAGFNNAFYYFRSDRKIRDWAIVRELIFVFGILLKQWRNDRFFENEVKLTRGEREVDDVNDCMDKNRCAFLETASGVGQASEHIVDRTL